jgi:hypothetical protein
VPENRPLTRPNLTSTTIDNSGPQLVFNAPRPGVTYDIDSELVVDYQCVDVSQPVYCQGSIPVGTVFDTSEAGTFELSVVAQDGFGFTSQREITFRIGPNSPPVVVAGEDQTVGSNGLVVLAGTATDIDDGQILSYTWQQDSGPPGRAHRFRRPVHRNELVHLAPRPGRARLPTARR